MKLHFLGRLCQQTLQGNEKSPRWFSHTVRQVLSISHRDAAVKHRATSFTGSQQTYLLQSSSKAYALPSTERMLSMWRRGTHLTTGPRFCLQAQNESAVTSLPSPLPTSIVLMNDTQLPKPETEAASHPIS